jgi:hypothetical protein
MAIFGRFTRQRKGRYLKMFSFRERFLGFSKGGNTYAPMTIGAPEYIDSVDYSVFKKDAKEKIELAVIKAQHKKEIARVHGNGSKRLNPSYG